MSVHARVRVHSPMSKYTLIFEKAGLLNNYYTPVLKEVGIPGNRLICRSMVP